MCVCIFNAMQKHYQLDIRTTFRVFLQDVLLMRYLHTNDACPQASQLVFAC